MIDPNIFRAYDIRGKADTQVTPEVGFAVGQAFGSTLRELYSVDSPTVVVGRDARTHGPALQQAVMEGLQKAGCRVLDIGQTPSPVNYFTICEQGFDGGIQVTASHNGPQDNGLKIQTRCAHGFCGQNLQDLHQRILDGNLLEGTGSIEEFDAETPYKKEMMELFPNVGEGLSVCIDSGNGVAGPLYTEILRNAGCTVDELYTEPDGNFPNHQADPSKWDTLRDLQSRVVKIDAACGLAYDGDGDRLGLVDEKGEVHSADDILLLLAQEELQKNPGGAVVYTVSSSSALETEVSRWGGTPVMTAVGHIFVEEGMEEHGANLGGEQSGHFLCFREGHHYDDALVATLHVLSIMQKADGSLSDLFATFPVVHQLQEKRPHCEDNAKERIVQSVTDHFVAQNLPVNTLDGARIDFGDGAWAGIRKSNTSPCLSVCIEARSPEKLQEVEEIVVGHLRGYEEVDI